MLVKKNQQVSVGKPLLVFDAEQIQAGKLSDTIMSLFPEEKEFILEFPEHEVKSGKLLLKV
ncbi:hypothetical protein [Candidatus Enterococcus ferrettii]|uniref:PTS EIIA type-1 domain-containing protein n=1 Tax=Candidatus Enterococcus ferrettii TaxID=2815324 RepID=A0ABV0ESE1_9ENTE|nr:hypothetical protein [Enterococcus sp. 665A]MBO1340604.1 hypothetical protein [Enterococcus sp. 665A]